MREIHIIIMNKHTVTPILMWVWNGCLSPGVSFIPIHNDLNYWHNGNVDQIIFFFYKMSLGPSIDRL